MNTDIVIIGAGAAGLMAGTLAGELGLNVVLVERKHLPGRKILMCGNNRCNISNNLSVEDMTAAYGEKVGGFLQQAISNFSPKTFRKFLLDRGLKTGIGTENRIYPESQRADDVLHFFTDKLRDFSVPVIYNSPVSRIKKTKNGYIITCDKLNLAAKYVLIATGGVSYPKTGSVGDGQKIARTLGHKVTPYKPGLAGIETGQRWMEADKETSINNTKVTIKAADGRLIGETAGEILCTRRCARGPAMVNASRLIAAEKSNKGITMTIDFRPDYPEDQVCDFVSKQFDNGRIKKWQDALSLFVPSALAANLCQELGKNPRKPLNKSDNVIKELASFCKGYTFTIKKVRPLKEAMVTVGGVDLSLVKPENMESKKCPNLYFAGEVLDIDGPTGGYNLHAAWSTAKLAVDDIHNRIEKEK